MTRAHLMLAAALVLGRAVPSAATTVQGALTLRGRAVEHAVVYLEGAREAPAPAAPRHVLMDQRNLAFVPSVLPVVRGTVVEFTNSDDVQHNVFSPSVTAKKFDLGTYTRGQAKRVTLDRPGDVLVLCNIHMEMQAHILVLRDPFFAITEASGRYQVQDVPAGTYTLKVWHERWLALDRTVEVTPAGALTVDIAE